MNKASDFFHQRWRMISLALIVLVVFLYVLFPYIRAAIFLARISNVGGAVERFAAWSASAVEEHEVLIPAPQDMLRARVYQPRGAWRRAVLLVPGLHWGGIDEPRLVPFARKLAGAGFTVVTPELRDLMEYRVVVHSVDEIEAALQWLMNHRELTHGKKVGVIGISFAGGLSMVAASRASVRNQVAYAFSFGGHGDLDRTLHFLTTGELPENRGRREPHIYGTAAILLSFRDHFVPPQQSPLLRDALLEAVKGDDQKTEKIAAGLPEPSAGLLRMVSARDVEKLGALLAPLIAEFKSDPLLSPERIDHPPRKIFLLHGEDDSVIPPEESELLAKALRKHPGVKVHLVVSPIITHVELDHTPRFTEVWQLIRFLRELLAG